MVNLGADSAVYEASFAARATWARLAMAFQRCTGRWRYLWLSGFSVDCGALGGLLGGYVVAPDGVLVLDGCTLGTCRPIGPWPSAVFWMRASHRCLRSMPHAADGEYVMFITYSEVFPVT